MSRQPGNKAPGPRVALVTGAARRIGAAIARELHRRGCRVIIHYLHNEQAAVELAGELNAIRGDSAGLAGADLVAPDGPERLAAQVREQTSRLDLLVNNASRFYPTPLGSVSHEQWKDLMGSNLRGPFFLTQSLLQELQGGAVVNIADIHGQRPMPGHAVYSMAKAAVEMMTRSMALDLAPDVRVNAVSPGAILWPEGEAVQADPAAVLEKVALGRLGDPFDIAAAVAYLGLDAPYVTGQVLAVDGGRNLNM
jgi:pteridine reductase